MRKKVYKKRVELCLSPLMLSNMKKAADESRDGPITVSELIRRILGDWLEGECY